MKKGIHIRPAAIRAGLVVLVGAAIVVAVREYPAARRYLSIETM